MREVGIVDNEAGLETTFDKISELAQDCRLKDCSHTSETGCAVIAAVDKGELEDYTNKYSFGFINFWTNK